MCEQLVKKQIIPSGTTRAISTSNDPLQEKQGNAITIRHSDLIVGAKRVLAGKLHIALRSQGVRRLRVLNLHRVCDGHSSLHGEENEAKTWSFPRETTTGQRCEFRSMQMDLATSGWNWRSLGQRSKESVPLVMMMCLNAAKRGCITQPASQQMSFSTRWDATKFLFH